MISLKRKESGFTIVELLIVIVVIGILAAIVVTTFTGVQKKGRDADRKSDVNAIYSQVEVYFAENAKYPTLANLQDATWRSANVKGLSSAAITAPGQTEDADGTLVASNGTINDYQYTVTPSGCDNTATDCTGFTLTSVLESGGTFVKTGSNN